MLQHSPDLGPLDITTIIAPVSISTSGTVSASASSYLSFITSAVDCTASVQGQTLGGSKVLRSSHTGGSRLVQSETG